MGLDDKLVRQFTNKPMGVVTRQTLIDFSVSFVELANDFSHALFTKEGCGFLK